MKYLLTFLLLFCLNVGATTFTEFYCDASAGNGTNINSGTTTNAAATYTSVNGNFNGSTTFTPTDGSTPASSVNIGDWAAIYVDGSTNLVQASAGGFVVRVLGVAAGANGAITLSADAFMGTAPSSSATGRSIKVGGAWAGPYRTIGFPFGFFATTATNHAQAMPRCNLRNTATYNVTAAMTHANAGPMRFQGMTATAGDGGKATIDGGTSGNYYVLLTASGGGNDFVDIIFAHNGASSTVRDGVASSSARNMFLRCVFHDFAKSGLTASGIAIIDECEIYNCPAAAGLGALHVSAAGSVIRRCIIHDNTGVGATSGNASTFKNCIFDSNGSSGILITSGSTVPCFIFDCDFYNNSGSGIDIASTASLSFIAENSNFFKNGDYGITSSGSSLRNGTIVNCAYGQGTQANTTAWLASNLGGINEIGSVAYTADQTPWTDPANGDFRIASTATLVKAAGRGAFTQTAASYAGTVAYPDIGAAQSPSTNTTATASGTSCTWAQ